MDIVSHPADPSLTAGLVALFRAAGCDCFCRYWHFAGDKNDWQARVGLAPEENRAELEARARAGSHEAAGLVAAAEGEVVGWLSLAPLRLTPKLSDHRYYRRLLAPLRDDEWAVGCVLVRPDWRGRGVAHALVAESLPEVLRRGGRSVVAFPRAHEGRLVDEEHMRGPPTAFEAAGFVRAGGDDGFPLLRKEA